MATDHTNIIQELDQEKHKPATPVTGKNGPSEPLIYVKNDLPNYSSQLEQSQANKIIKLKKTINNLMRRIERDQTKPTKEP